MNLVRSRNAQVAPVLREVHRFWAAQAHQGGTLGENSPPELEDRSTERGLLMDFSNTDERGWPSQRPRVASLTAWLKVSRKRGVKVGTWGWTPPAPCLASQLRYIN